MSQVEVTLQMPKRDCDSCPKKETCPFNVEEIVRLSEAADLGHPTPNASNELPVNLSTVVGPQLAKIKSEK